MLQHPTAHGAENRTDHAEACAEETERQEAQKGRHKATHVVVKTTIAEKASNTSTIVDMRPGDRPPALLHMSVMSACRPKGQAPIDCCGKHL